MYVSLHFVVSKTRNQPKRLKTTQPGQQKHPRNPKSPNLLNKKTHNEMKQKWNCVKQKSKSEKFRQNS